MLGALNNLILPLLFIASIGLLVFSLVLWSGQKVAAATEAVVPVCNWSADLCGRDTQVVSLCQLEIQSKGSNSLLITFFDRDKKVLTRSLLKLTPAKHSLLFLNNKDTIEMVKQD